MTSIVLKWPGELRGTPVAYFGPFAKCWGNLRHVFLLNI